MAYSCGVLGRPERILNGAQQAELARWDRSHAPASPSEPGQALLGLDPEVRIQDYRDPLDGSFDADRVGGDGRARGRGPVPGLLRGPVRQAPAGRPAADPADVPDCPLAAAACSSSPHIAPDMYMRPVGDTIRLIEDAGFEASVEAMREHYVRTIRAWLENFEANLPRSTQILSAEQVVESGASTWPAARWLSSRAGWAWTRSSRKGPRR